MLGMVQDKQRILEGCCHLVPSLKHAQVVSDWAGLRPARDRVRLELEFHQVLVYSPLICWTLSSLPTFALNSQELQCHQIPYLLSGFLTCAFKSVAIFILCLVMLSSCMEVCAPVCFDLYTAKEDMLHFCCSQCVSASLPT